MEKVKLGVVGLGQRGSTLIQTVFSCDETEVIAICDTYEDRREAISNRVTERYGKKPTIYDNYENMLKDKNIEAVLICSSWDEHIRMAIESMKAGKITAMEVGGAYDIEECWELVRTYEETKTPIMMLENCCWDRFELLTTKLARAGKLGEVVHCHGAYGHDLREEVLGGYVKRHYRLDNYIKRNCENYPTHELGPIAKLLDINRGNKMLTLTAMSSKAAGLEEFAKSEKNPDKSLRGIKFAQGDIVSTTIKCANGETITLSLDTTLPRYYSREFEAHGTKGLTKQETDMIFLDMEREEEYYEPHLAVKKYLNNSQEYKEFLPKIWQDITPEAQELGHGGMDYLMLKAFFKAVSDKSEMPVDVYDAAAWMAITALTEQSIAQGGAPQAVPDFTKGKWIKRVRLDVTEL